MAKAKLRFIRLLMGALQSTWSKSGNYMDAVFELRAHEVSDIRYKATQFGCLCLWTNSVGVRGLTPIVI